MESKAILLGQYIKKQRNKNNMSMASLSKICDLSISHISRIERGVDPQGKEISPSLDVIERVAKALNLNINDLLVDSGYVSATEEITDPLYFTIGDFLKHPEVVRKYDFNIENLSDKELKDAYRIILDSIDLISFKYK